MNTGLIMLIVFIAVFVILARPVFKKEDNTKGEAGSSDNDNPKPDGQPEK